MIEWIKNLFKHEHDYKQYDLIYHTSKFYKNSALPCTAIVYKCKCGKTRRELTQAGVQQVWEFGDSISDVLGLE